MAKTVKSKVEKIRSLDPNDWEAFRKDGHRALDHMIDYLQNIREQPVWRKAPDDARARFKTPAPRKPRPLGDVIDDFSAHILPYANGNLHPLFMGWVHGAGTPVGMIAEMLAAGLNSNCGGRDHIAHVVEKQITSWMAHAFGLPKEASGIFVTGASMANFLAVLTARNKALGADGRKKGLAEAGARLTAYASRETHSCVKRAIEQAGIGLQHLRVLGVDAQGAVDLVELRQRIAADKAAGFKPFLIVGTAGSVNFGAFDDLPALAAIAKKEKIWLHVDGAFGALAAFSDQLRPRIKGIEKADSVAFDFHKWAQVPYDAGFLIVRDPQAHYEAFADRPVYLAHVEGGLGGGGVWPCDLGMDLSRSFRALKTWFTFQTFGADALAETIERTCAVARRLEKLINASAVFETRAPVGLNIVCFGVKGAKDGGALNQKIVVDLQERGLAAPSTTKIGQDIVIRAAIVNHRTQLSDMDAFFEELLASAKRLRS